MNKQQIKQAINAENKRHSDAIRELNDKLWAIERDEAYKSRAAYQKRKDLLDDTGEWLNKNKIIQVGDIVKVTGSRAGAYRKVTQLQYFCIIGQVARESVVKNPDGTRSRTWIFSASTVTSHMMNKVTHILRDGVFVAVKDLMQKDLKEAVDI